jgi:hypothetical protein
VRAMVQIGGTEAGPAVDYLLTEIPTARGRDLFDISVYLGLLGPVAERAMPALQEARSRDRELCSMALWAVAPEKQFPWQWGYTADRDIDRWLFEAYIREMGDRVRPSAVALAQRVVAGTAGRVPKWGYQLLADFPGETLEILTESLDDSVDAAVRLRVITALGQMGSAAAPARPKVQALAEKADPATRGVLTWCLDQMGQ